MFVPVYHTSPWMLPLCILAVLLFKKSDGRKPRRENSTKRSESTGSSLYEVFYTEFDVITHLEHIIDDKGITSDGKMYVDLKCYTLDKIDRIQDRYIEELKRKVKVRCIKNILEILRRPIDDKYRETLENILKEYL